MSYFWTHVNILHVVKYSTHKMERHKDSASNYNWVRGSTRDASRFYNTWCYRPSDKYQIIINHINYVRKPKKEHINIIRSPRKTNKKAIAESEENIHLTPETDEYETKSNNGGGTNHSCQTGE